MRSHPATLALIVAAGLIAPTGAWSQNLSGPARAAFIAGTSAHCIGAVARDHAGGNMPARAVKAYCSCYARTIADRASADEIAAGPSAPGMAGLSNEAVKTCYDALPANERK